MRNATLAFESRFDLASNAAHSLSLAVLPHTLGLGAEVWRVLDKCHNTRNLGEYEGMLDVDERLVADLMTATQLLADTLANS